MVPTFSSEFLLLPLLLDATLVFDNRCRWRQVGHLEYVRDMFPVISLGFAVINYWFEGVMQH